MKTTAAGVEGLAGLIYSLIGEQKEVEIFADERTLVVSRDGKEIIKIETDEDVGFDEDVF